MSFKTKLALITIGIVLLTAGVLAIRQKVAPESESILTLTGGDESALQDFDEQMSSAVSQLDSFFEENDRILENSNINTNINVNASSKEKRQEIKNKFDLSFYAQAKIEKDLAVLSEKKITTATLSTDDEKDDVIEFYKQELGDQVKEVKSIDEEASDDLEATLILFSDEGGEGNLSVKIWSDEEKEKTYINLVISDNFKDPRQEDQQQ